MAVIWFEGFENGAASPSSVSDNYQDVNGAVSIQNTVKRSGEFALRINPSGATNDFVGFARNGADGVYRGYSNLFNLATLYVRFYFQYATAPASNHEPIFEPWSMVGTKKGSLRLDSTFHLRLYDSADVNRSVSAGTLAANTWYCIEQIWNTGSSALVEIYVDGVLFTTGTFDTRTSNHGNIYIGRPSNAFGNAVDYYYDDLVLEDAVLPGPGSVIRLDCNANTAIAGWSGGTNSSDFNEVDEIPSDGDTTYIETSSTNASVFDLETIVAAGGPASATVAAVRAQAVVKRTTGNASTIKARLDFSGSTVESSGVTPTNGTYKEFDHLVLVRPNDSAPWNYADIASVAVGVSDAATSSAVRCTAVRAYVDLRHSGSGGGGGGKSGLFLLGVG